MIQKLEPPNTPLVSQCSQGFILGGIPFLDPLGGLGLGGVFTALKVGHN